MDLPSKPLASIAVVFPLASNAPWCPHVSQPVASPETMLNPLLENSQARYFPPMVPSFVGSLVPITAIPGSFVMEKSPRYHKRSGGFTLPSSSTVFLNDSGKSSS